MLAEALKNLPVSTDPNLLVGFNKADDAGVYKISDNIALVQTVDFFPPIVDDPYYFGQIAAANALSDVYAMGGRPLTALNIVGFPVSKMPPSILNDVLRGGCEKIEEAGAVIVGGHSIDDKELKYGVSVTGLIDPTKIFSNDGAKVGDVLFLTKPIGTGVITTGIKQNVVDEELIELVTLQMSELNRTAAEIMIQFDAHAATDITGFGLAGHAYEIASASDVSIEFRADSIPLLPKALELAEAGMIPAGGNANRSYLSDKIEISATIDDNIVHLVFDPQTSGGLLIAIDPARADEFESELMQKIPAGARIGQVVKKGATALVLN